MLRGLAIVAGGAVWPAGGSSGTGQLQGIEGARCGSLVARSRPRLGRGDHSRCARSALLAAANFGMPCPARVRCAAHGGIRAGRRRLAAVHFRCSQSAVAARCKWHACTTASCKTLDLVALGSRGRGRRAGFAILCCRGRPRTLANVCRPSVGSDSPCARCSESESCLYYR